MDRIDYGKKPGMVPAPEMRVPAGEPFEAVLHVDNDNWTATYGYLYTSPWSGEHVYSLIGYKPKDDERLD